MFVNAGFSALFCAFDTTIFSRKGLTRCKGA